MDFHLLLRNRHVSRVLVGVPDGHQHIRARIETGGGDVITLQEATLAAIARAYLSVSTHPTRNAVELRAAEIKGRKDGFAEVHLLETDTDEATIRELLAAPPPQAGDSEAHTESVTSPGETEIATEHGRPDDDSIADLDLDDPLELDDGPVFGDVPTMHSRPPDEDNR
jgi:hypothetical protein